MRHRPFDPFAKKRPEGPDPEMPLEVLDASGKPLLVMPRNAVLRQKLSHKGVLVCLQDRAGRLFIHRRPPGSFSYAGMWDIASAGRLLAGESYHDAGLRLLRENWDMTGADLHEVPRVPEIFDGPANTKLRLFVSPRVDILPRHANGETVDGMFADEDELAAVIREFPAAIRPVLLLAVSRLFPGHPGRAK
jgi:hypothetical protein